MLVRTTVISLLAIWLLLTVVRQITNRPSLWRWDVFCLIPRWTFFAPKPIESDYLLLTRAGSAPGRAQPWRESPFGRRRVARELLFNPGSRCHRVLYVLTLETLREARRADGTRGGERRFRETLSRAVRSLPVPQEPSREALIVQSFGFVTDRPPRAVMALDLTTADS